MFELCAVDDKKYCLFFLCSAHLKIIKMKHYNIDRFNLFLPFSC